MKFLVIVYTLCGQPHHIFTYEENTGFVKLMSFDTEVIEWIDLNYPIDQTDLVDIPLEVALEGTCL